MAFIKISEQPSLYNDLEKKSVREILEDINTEDQKVALAVQKAIPQIEKLVNLIVPRMKQGGRIIYMGAGTSGPLGVLDSSEIPPTFGMPNTLVIGLIAGGDTALRNPVENAEDARRAAAAFQHSKRGIDAAAEEKRHKRRFQHAFDVIIDIRLRQLAHKQRAR